MSDQVGQAVPCITKTLFWMVRDVVPPTPAVGSITLRGSAQLYQSLLPITWKLGFALNVAMLSQNVDIGVA